MNLLINVAMVAVWGYTLICQYWLFRTQRALHKVGHEGIKRMSLQELEEYGEVLNTPRPFLWLPTERRYALALESFNRKVNL